MHGGYKCGRAPPERARLKNPTEPQSERRLSAAEEDVAVALKTHAILGGGEGVSDLRLDCAIKHCVSDNFP